MLKQSCATAEEKKQPYSREGALFRTVHGAPIRDRLLFAVTHRGVMHTAGSHAVLSALLDARYRNSAFDQKSEWLFPVSIQRSAIAELRRLELEIVGVHAAPPPVVHIEPVVQPEQRQEQRGALRRLRPPAPANPPPAAVAVPANSTEVDRYLMLPIYHFSDVDMDDPISAVNWWRQNESKFPVLARIAKRYLAIPASSAEPERVWSAAKLICSGLRGSLLGKTFVDHLLVHRNKDLLLDGD